ncbi:hypothetical protein FQR65_LT15973 [Abscondita terminalis]|nr:hypothetical protein FQR65_LT15973 [Abscondita terminalis]
MLSLNLTKALEVSTVQSKWITPHKKRVYWPPPPQYLRALKKGDDVNSSWTIYPIKRIFYETDEFKKADQKLKRCQYTSDINTEQETDNEQKRKRVVTRQISSSSEEENDYHETTALSRPPSIKRRVEIYNTPVVDKELGSIGNSEQFTSTIIYPGSTSSRASTPETLRNSSGPNTPRNLQSINSNRRDVLELLLGRVIKLEEQNKQILHLLNKILYQSAPSSTGNVPDDLPVPLPLQHQVDVDTFEEYLSSQEHITAISSYLSTLGGRDLATKTNRVMRYLISDKLATSYSFYGKRANKKSFSNLKLKDVIIRSVKEPGEKSLDVENCIKVWLKHAPARVKAAETKHNNLTKTK